jgi:hypothetical protein
MGLSASECRVRHAIAIGMEGGAECVFLGDRLVMGRLCIFAHGEEVEILNGEV